MRDVIVIGAGAGGPVVAKEIASRGLDVLVLEAGGRNAVPELEWTRFDNDSQNLATGYFRFGPADRSKPAWLRDVPHEGTPIQSSGVGGTTVRYAANCPRAVPSAFMDSGGGGADYSFPLAYRELIPYYEWVEATLPVQTAAMGTKELVFLDGAGRLGLPHITTKDVTHAGFRPQENAILQPRGNPGNNSDRMLGSYPRSAGCTSCGHCFGGCINPHGAPENLIAKRSTNYSYIPMALTAGNWAHMGRPITLVTDAFAVWVGTENEQQRAGLRANRVTWRIGATGELMTEEARVIVLAGGAVETPRLWFNSGLPNPNDWVGRGLTDHFGDVVIGVMPFYTGHSVGPSSAARVDYPGFGMLECLGAPPANTAFSLTASDQGFAHPPADPGSGPAQPDMIGGLVGPELKWALSDVDRLLTAYVVTDDDVDPMNRVTLSSAYPPDEHGPVARLEIAIRSAAAVAKREFLAAEAIQLMRALGAQRVYRIGAPPFAAAHLHSTMRMGHQEGNSIADANCEARAVNRLFIADASVLANGLGGPNPALTIQALATRTAERIFRLYFGGDAWVHRESPVCSTDPRIAIATSSQQTIQRCLDCHSKPPIGS